MISLSHREMDMLMRLSKSPARQFPDGSVRVTIAAKDWKAVKRLGEVIAASATQRARMAVPVPPEE